MSSGSCTFTNDNGVEVLLPPHRFSSTFARRDNHEVLFRRIVTTLILEGVIRGNVVDAGAWIGDNTIPWAKNLPDATIYAFDPSEENCLFIYGLTRLNSLTNVAIFGCPLGSSRRTLYTGDDIGHCTFSDEPPANVRHTAVSNTLDALVAEGKVADVDFIHLDVEGMEWDVLRGAEGLLRTWQPLMALEQHLEKDDYHGMADYLKGMGYTVYVIQEVLPNCRLDCRNLLAIPARLQPETLVKRLLSSYPLELL